METDKKNLIVLLKYLIDHNKEHSQELKGLVNKTKGSVTETAQEYISEAAQRMDDSIRSLMKALSELDAY